MTPPLPWTLLPVQYFEKTSQKRGRECRGALQRSGKMDFHVRGSPVPGQETAVVCREGVVWGKDSSRCFQSSGRKVEGKGALGMAHTMSGASKGGCVGSEHNRYRRGWVSGSQGAVQTCASCTGRIQGAWENSGGSGTSLFGQEDLTKLEDLHDPLCAA